MGSDGVIANLPGFPEGSLELLVEGDAGPPRFICVEADRWHRSYLARICLDNGMTQRTVALKVQRDQYSDENEEPEEGRNRDVERLFESEHTTFLKTEGTRISPHLVRYFPIAGEKAGEGPATLAVLPPLLYWPQRRLFFHPPCPTCGTILRDCRDDRLLARHSLALFSASNIRYLHCPSCAQGKSGQGDASPESVLFYRILPTEREEELHVGNEARLYEAIVQSLDRMEEPSLPLLAPRGDRLPIRPGELKPEEILAFSFHDTRVLPFQFVPLTWRTFCHALGDMPWERLREEASASWEGALPEEDLLDLEQRVSSPDRYLLAAARPEVWPLEVFRLKLGLFQQLCAAVQAFHEEFGRAHLALRPRNITVALPATSCGLAGFWNFTVKLRTLSTGTRLHRDEREPSWEHRHRPLGAHRDYLPAFASDDALRGVHPAEVRLKSVRKTDNGAHEVRLLLHPAPGISVRKFSAGDVFEITLSGPDLAEPVTIEAQQPVAVARNGVELQSLPAVLSGNEVNALQANLDRVLRHASFRCLPLYHIPCDLHALGMILLETLLGDAETDASVLMAKLVGPAIDAIRSARQTDPAVTGRDLDARILDFLQENEWAQPGRLTCRPGAPVTIAEDLWSTTLLLGLKLATAIRGFSWCTDRSDFPHDQPAGLLARLGEDVEAIAREVHCRLFAPTESREEAEPEQAEYDDESPAAPAAERAFPPVVPAGEAAEVRNQVRQVVLELLLGPPRRRPRWNKPGFEEHVENLLKDRDPLHVIREVVPPLGHFVSRASNNFATWLAQPYGLSKSILRFHTALAEMLAREDYGPSVHDYLAALRSCIKELVEQPLAVLGESLQQLELHFNPRALADNCEPDKLTKGRKAVAWDALVEAYARAHPFGEFIFPRIRRHVEERMERYLFRLSARHRR